MRCTLSFNCPRRGHAGYCCFTCGIRETCTDACLNTPDRCMVSRESTPTELVFEYGMKRVETKGEFNKIMETGQPAGLIYYSTTYGSRAIDNRTGTPVLSEELDTSEEAIHWLQARVEADRKGAQHER